MIIYRPIWCDSLLTANVEAPIFSCDILSSRNSTDQMDYRRVGFAVLATHIVRSILGRDAGAELTVQITLLQAEVSRAETVIRKTSIILEHCNSYTGFLTYILKLVAFSELLLLIWIVYLLIARRPHPLQLPALTDQIASETTLSDSSDSSDHSPSSTSLVRTGPTRPSDLRKIARKD